MPLNATLAGMFYGYLLWKLNKVSDAMSFVITPIFVAETSFESIS